MSAVEHVIAKPHPDPVDHPAEVAVAVVLSLIATNNLTVSIHHALTRPHSQSQPHADAKAEVVC